jgi:hypothetical protein
MTKRTMIDAHVARNVADAVEHLTDLQGAMKEIRWYMARGEPGMMPIWRAKKATNALKSALGSLEYAIEQAKKGDGDADHEPEAEPGSAA